MSVSPGGRAAAGRFENDVAAQYLGQVDAWCTHPALMQLVEMFGGNIPQGLTLSARLAFLDEFSTVWDYLATARQQSATRLNNQDAGGAFRWLIPRLDLPVAQLEQIVHLTGELGLIAELQPNATEFDHLVVIGGGRYTNLPRTRYAGELAADRRIAGSAISSWRMRRDGCWSPNRMQLPYARLALAPNSS